MYLYVYSCMHIQSQIKITMLVIIWNSGNEFRICKALNKYYAYGQVDYSLKNWSPCTRLLLSFVLQFQFKAFLCDLNLNLQYIVLSMARFYSKRLNLHHTAQGITKANAFDWNRAAQYITTLAAAKWSQILMIRLDNQQGTMLLVSCSACLTCQCVKYNYQSIISPSLQVLSSCNSEKVIYWRYNPPVIQKKRIQLKKTRIWP